jgi:OmpA family
MRLITCFLFSACLQFIATIGAQTTLQHSIYFNYNKYELNAIAITTLDSLIQDLKSKQVKEIHLYGHTDADGTDAYNISLSKNRNAAVQRYLISKGLDSVLIKLDFYGEMKPKELNGNSESKARNRRVEVTILFNEKIAKTLALKDLENAPQYFRANCDSDIIIKGNEGTVITIPKGSLILLSGKTAKGIVDIKLSEYYTKSDILLANLHTLSGTELLESGGMINMEVGYKKQKLEIAENSNVTVKFNNQYKKDFQIFNGKISNKTLDWIPARLGKSYSYVRTQKTLKIGPIKTKIPIDFKYETILDESGYSANDTIDQMLFNVDKFGWINCDRFLREKNLTNMNVKVNSPFLVNVRLVFKEINSVMSSYTLKESMCANFTNIPTGKQVTLIAFGEFKKKHYFVSKQITISSGHTEMLDMKTMSLSEIKTELQKLN